MASGVEIRCEEKGSCPAGCHLCHHLTPMGGASGRGHASGGGKRGEQPSPIPVLLEVSRVVPLYSLVQDNVTKEVRKPGGSVFHIQRSKVIANLPPVLYVLFAGDKNHSVPDVGTFLFALPVMVAGVAVVPIVPNRCSLHQSPLGVTSRLSLTTANVRCNTEGTEKMTS